MKFLLMQHWNGRLGELEKLSVANMKAYAELCGADYKLVTGLPFGTNYSLQSQKMTALLPEYDDYDIVVMLDTDMFTRVGLIKNIFTEETGIGRHYGIQEVLVQKIAQQFPHLCAASSPYFGGSIYRLEKNIRQEFRKHINDFELLQFNNNYNDEGIMHRLALLSGLEVSDSIYLTRDMWNKSSFEEDVEDSYIVHIRPKVKQGGPKRPKIENYRALVERGII